MLSVKAVLRNHRNPKGEKPIAIRITKDGKSSYIFTGFYTDEKYWDNRNKELRKSHPNRSRVNNYLNKKISDIIDIGLRFEDKDEPYSARDLFEHIKADSQQSDFISCAEHYLKNLLKRKKYNQHTADNARIKYIKEFLGRDKFPFEQLTVLKLQDFGAWLMEKREASERTVANYYVVIRSIFNLAIRSGIVEQKYYPFGRGKIIIRFPDAGKIGLTKEEVEILENLEYQVDNPRHHARNLWLLSFYFAGMRTSDLMRLKWSHIDGEWLNYRMHKNNKYGPVYISPKAKDILDQYEPREGSDYMFPEMDKADSNDPKDVTRKVNNANHVLNKYLGKITTENGILKDRKKADGKTQQLLTMHLARHTFGRLAGNKIPIQMLQKLYRHTSITTTIQYQSHFMVEDERAALESVIG